MKTIYSFFFCLSAYFSSGQLQITNVSSAGQCDGSAYFYGNMYNHSDYALLSKIVGQDTFFVQENTHDFNNLCEGNYILVSTFIDGSPSSVSKFSIKNNNSSPCERFSLASSTEESIDVYLGGQNGYRIVRLAEQNGTPPFQYFYDSTPNNGFITTYDFGQHSVKVIDSLGCVDSILVELVPSNICRIHTAMGEITTSETISNACDGSCNLTPLYINDSSLIANHVHVFWDNGTEGLSQSNLCPGFHLVTIVVDTSLTQSCHNKSFIYIEDALDSVFVYGNYVNTLDVLYSDWIDECSINLTAIQSAEILDYHFVSTDSILVTWLVRDTNQVVVNKVVGYHIPNTSENYNFVLQLYCLQKSFPVYAHAIDQYYIGELGLTNSNLNEVTISPNPAENTLYIKCKIDFDSFTISDMSGKIVKSQDYTSEINIEDLQSGIYLLHLYNNENVVLIKFVKN
jgi:hypothetical protein